MVSKVNGTTASGSSESKAAGATAATAATTHATSKTATPADAPLVLVLHANATVDELYLAGKIELELVPQGTLAERIRAAGAGLGGACKEFAKRRRQ